MQLALAVGGGLVGSLFGQPMMGFAIGAAIGGLLFPPEDPNAMPDPASLKVQTSTYGNGISIVEGVWRKSGNIIWCPDFTVTKNEQGGMFGKGMGADAAAQKPYIVTASFAISLCNHQIAGIRKIWANSKLIYDISMDASLGSLSAISQKWGNSSIHSDYIDAINGVSLTSLRVYYGTETQQPDPVIEAVEGVGNVPAYRGQAYVVFEDMELTDYGDHLPNLNFEIVREGTFTDFEVTNIAELPYSGSWSGCLTARGLIVVIECHFISWYWGYSAPVSAVSSDGGLTWQQGEECGIPGPCTLYVVNDIFWVNNSAAAPSPDGPWAYSFDGIVWTSSTAPEPNPKTEPVPPPPYPTPPASVQAIACNGAYCIGVTNMTYSWVSWRYGDDDWVAHNNATFAGVGNGICWDGMNFVATNCTGGGNTITLFTPVFRLDAIHPTLGEIVGRVADECGYDPSDIDVTDLTNEVFGLEIVPQVPGKSVLEQLMSVYFFDAVESDWIIKFVPLGGTSVATIPTEDLAAHEHGEETPDRLTKNRIPENDLPTELNVLYTNRGQAYQQGKQTAMRLTTGSMIAQTIQVPISMNDTQARRVADVALYLTWTRRTPYAFTTSRKWSHIEPTDIVKVNDGLALHELRIIKKDESLAGLITWEGSAEDASIYDQTNVGGDARPDNPEIPIIGQTILKLMDTPIVRDDDNNAGYYLAVCGARANWQGAVIFKSIDNGATYNPLLSVLTESVIGRATTVLGNWTGPNIIDETNFVNITLDHGELSSVSELAMLNGANLALLGDELIQFRDAPLIDTGRYTISGLLRHRFGTEWATGTHVRGERFVLLTLGTTLRPTDDISNRNLARLYKPVTIGRRVIGTTAQSFTNTAMGLKPLSPVHIGGGSNDAEDLIINWKRRTRIAGAWADSVDVSLGESSESYEIDIMDGATVKRTLTSTTPTVTSSKANMTADFAVRPTSVAVRVYQMSASVGRGFVGNGVVPYPAPKVPNMDGLNTAMLADGPFALYRLNETSGTTASDASGNARHGTYTGGVTLNQTIAGVVAAQFDGSNDYVLLPTGFTDFSLGATFEVFIYISTRNRYWAYFHGPGGDDMMFRCADNTDAYMYIYNDYAGSTSRGVTGVLPDKWQLWTFACDSSGVYRIFLNGVQKGYWTGGWTLRNALRDTNYIGRYSTDYFHGYMRQVAIYNKPLTDAQIMAHAVAAELA